MLKNNYHTHMRFCNHAEGDVIDYVKMAVDLGFLELGMTDHGPIPTDFMNEVDYKRTYSYENMKYETIGEYLAQIDDARDKYGDKIKIYSGFEVEYLYGHDEYYKDLRSKVDYLNLGIHFFEDDKGVLYDTYSDVTYKNLSYYVKTIIDALNLGIYNTLVHPDLFMYGYKNVDGKREFDDAAIKASKEIIEACIKNNVYVEINANGIKNDYDKPYKDFLYPYIDFWKIASNYKDLKIIVGADSHKPSLLTGKHIKRVYEMIDLLSLNVLDRMEINH